jgi:hypothetical protein
MKTRILAMALLALVACKKKNDGGDKAGATPTTAAAPAGAAPAAKAAEAPGGCPAGFTNPDNLGLCVKLVDGLKPDANVGHSGTQKAVGWTADGDVDISIKTSEYDSMFWDQSIKDLVAGGGFGGKLVDQKPSGDGVIATFTADDPPRQRKLLITRIHNDKLTAECWAEKQVLSTTGPKLEDVLAVCANAQLAK